MSRRRQDRLDIVVTSVSGLLVLGGLIYILNRHFGKAADAGIRSLLPFILLLATVAVPAVWRMARKR